jgi:radical SAM protein with 4Fe4S-binding SPASM domain
MSYPVTERVNLPDFALWQQLRKKNIPSSFEMELTPRCNNNCRHCYINIPASTTPTGGELPQELIRKVADEAAALGVIWVLLTGGEPLLRHDFEEIYLLLRKKGLLITVFTNGNLLTMDHVRLFKKHPPRALEITVYGATPETYETVTRVPGSFKTFTRSIELLKSNNIPFNLKTVALRSNIHEFEHIAAFCRTHSTAPFRFDPLLHLRYDGDPQRNRDIVSERLNPGQIAQLDHMDPQRSGELDASCHQLITGTGGPHPHLFHCTAATDQFVLGYDGLLRPCSALWHPDFRYDARSTGLKEALQKMVETISAAKSNDPRYLSTCGQCDKLNLCHWCPAHGYLETGTLDGFCDYFCDTAHSRARRLSGDHD